MLDFPDDVKHDDKRRPLFNIRTPGAVRLTARLRLFTNTLSLLGHDDPQIRALAARQLRDIISVCGLSPGAVAVLLGCADTGTANARARVLDLDEEPSW